MDSEVKQRLDAELAKIDGSGADVGKLSPGVGSLNTKLALYIADKLDQLEPGGGGGGKDNNLAYGSSKANPKNYAVNTLYCGFLSQPPEGIANWYHRKADGTEEILPFNYEKPYLLIPYVGTNQSGDNTYDWIGFRDANGDVITTSSTGYSLSYRGWDETYGAWKVQSYSSVGYFPIIYF